MVIAFIIILSLSTFNCFQYSSNHIFYFNASTFLMDNKPIKIRAGEMHYPRIPPEYWTDRMQMAKGMGLNAISTYVFWNFHEFNEGKFDFESATHDLGRFIDLAHQEGLYVLLRAGPFICAEWEFGGFPYWLLNHKVSLRSSDQKYLGFVERFFQELSKIVIPRQITKGGPIIMFQIENEYGFYGNDHKYTEHLKDLWVSLGVEVPFYTADGDSLNTLQNGHVEKAVIGIDTAMATSQQYEYATQVDSSVVSFNSETYPGWFTQWGDKKWGSVTIERISTDIKFILDSGKSFSLYMIHGGTNFGFWAGSTYMKLYSPHITSYDYDAPVTENGDSTDKYNALRELISKYTDDPLPNPPAPIPTMQIPTVYLTAYSSIWETPQIPTHQSAFPQNFEFFNQFSGIMIYETTLTGQTYGTLEIKGLADYGLVFVDDVFIGTLNRQHAFFQIEIPNKNRTESKLEIVVEAMGRVNSGHNIYDTKGINGNVSLQGKIIENWSMKNLPFDINFMDGLKKASNFNKQGIIYIGNFLLNSVKDTFIDLTQWEKGIVFVNGENLGRYWNIGPQYRLYCPSSYLKTGENTIMIFDLHLLKGSFITGEKTSK